MPVIAWDSAQMDATVARIRSIVSQLQAQGDELRRRVAQLDQAWEGSDKQAYLACQQTWSTALTDLPQALEQMGAFVLRAQYNLDGASQANRRGWA